MNDLIERQAAIDIFDDYNVSVENGELDAYSRDRKRLCDLPSAQPDIIACGDCKHWICHERRCGFWNHGVKPLDWCCYAERRTDGNGRD